MAENNDQKGNRTGKIVHTLSKYLSVEEETIDHVFIVRPEGAIYIPEAEQFDRFIK